MNTHWLIVGAGFTGSVLAERIATDLNQKVLIIEKRAHIGGDAYDFINEYGHIIHRYGPHVLYVNNQSIYQYLSKFTDWIPYKHKARAVVNGNLLPVPFNLESLYAVFPKNIASEMESLLKGYYGIEKSVPVLKLLSHHYKRLSELGNFIYDKIYSPYTKKMWGCAPEELDLYVTGRVPVRVTWKDEYHHAKYTVIPKGGYSNLFHNLLDHENIDILTNTDYNDIKDDIKYKRMIYTGPLDEFFNFIYGELPYRSMRFEYKTFNTEFCQDVAQVNYPGSEPYIRIVEQKHVTGQIDSRTSIVIEYPEPYIRGKNIPHYPILCKTNRDLYRMYLKEAENLAPKILFAGRSADYKYYCIEQAVARALSVFENQIR